jgi:phosphoacetylglucosamine mutase
MTTPELHIRTKNINYEYAPYYTNIFNDVYNNVYNNVCNNTISDNYEKAMNILVDCSNGSGMIPMEYIKNNIKNINMRLINNTDPLKVNYKCGADYIYTSNGHITYDVGPEIQYIACLDGDADRLIMYDNKNKTIIDGNKIGIIMALFIKKHLKITDYTICFIQTAYANIASTNYIRNKLKINTYYTPTGVKYLHSEAEKYDIGIYFESNGHGTILFSDNFVSKLHTNNEIEVLSLYRLLNQCVGDGICNLLALCYIMTYDNNDISYMLDTLNIHYIPHKQYSIVVADKNIYTTTYDETKLIKPYGLQQELDNIMMKYNARLFIRPSNTENIIRIYI